MVDTDVYVTKDIMEMELIAQTSMSATMQHPLVIPMLIVIIQMAATDVCVTMDSLEMEPIVQISMNV
jgi:hypothetical protein